MILSNSISAPQLTGGIFIYLDWAASTGGGLSEFYDLLTSPSIDREEFLETMTPDIDLSGELVEITYRGKAVIGPEPGIIEKPMTE